MSFSKEQIKKFAKSVKLKLSDEDIEKMNINAIEEWAYQLQQVNTDGVEPLFTPCENNISIRNDVVKKDISRDEILSNSPDKAGIKLGYFAVPKVMDEE